EARVSLDRALLQLQHRAQHRRANTACDRFAIRPWQGSQDARQGQEQHGDAEIALSASLSPLAEVRLEGAQTVNTPRYLLMSSRMRPAPRTTQVSGSSSTWIGRLVSRAMS